MKPYYQHAGITIYHGDCREVREFVNTCVTSPPYFELRDYGNDLQIGNEVTLPHYLENCEIATKRLSQEILQFEEPIR